MNSSKLLNIFHGGTTGKRTTDQLAWRDRIKPADASIIGARQLQLMIINNH